MELHKKLNKRYRVYKKLQLEGYTHKKMELKDFIEIFFKKLNIQYKTIDNSGSIHGYKGAHRSLIDLFSVCRTYYPKIKIEDVTKNLFELCKEKKVFGIWLCETIGRYVFSKTEILYKTSNLEDRKLTMRGKNTETISKLYEELGYSEKDFLKKK